jgi:lipid II:glycine glycyltransferase (peptidoglycan interpeptide bridge formation enzyme)
MSKENNAPSDPNSDVDSIRKILFGDQLAQIEEYVKRVENSVNQLQAENRNLRQALEMEVSAREKADSKLKELLAAAEHDQTEIRNQGLSVQVKLLDSLKKGLDQYKTDITSGQKTEK